MSDVIFDNVMHHFENSSRFQFHTVPTNGQLILTDNGMSRLKDETQQIQCRFFFSRRIDAYLLAAVLEQNLEMVRECVSLGASIDVYLPYCARYNLGTVAIMYEILQHSESTFWYKIPLYVGKIHMHTKEFAFADVLVHAMTVSIQHRKDVFLQALLSTDFDVQRFQVLFDIDAFHERLQMNEAQKSFYDEIQQRVFEGLPPIKEQIPLFWKWMCEMDDRKLKFHVPSCDKMEGYLQDHFGVFPEKQRIMYFAEELSKCPYMQNLSRRWNLILYNSSEISLPPSIKKVCYLPSYYLQTSFIKIGSEHLLDSYLLERILHNDTKQVKRLLFLGANPNCKEDRAENTYPIHVCARFGSRELIQIMIEWGMSLTNHNNRLSRTKHWAEENPVFFKTLEEYGVHVDDAT